MCDDAKIRVYQSIIHYLLDATALSIQKIANLANSSLKDIEAIYHHGNLTRDNKAELNLIYLFATLTELEIQGKWQQNTQRHLQ